MSKYRELIHNNPTLKVAKNAREVIFTTISCMCDNVKTLRFKKNSEGDFKLSGNGFALSNWQMSHSKSDIEWTADDENWNEVINMINTGTAVIHSVKSR